ncbi:MAG: hypothetical protein LBG98_01345 [Puniceicoccales bacterium]|nr:hypothetical protein [Puniceicoccales bacterium]
MKIFIFPSMRSAIADKSPKGFKGGRPNPPEPIPTQISLTQQKSSLRDIMLHKEIID